MRDILKTEELEIPDGVTVTVKSRVIVVSGPRGTLTKNVRHVNMDIRLLKGKGNKVILAVWQGNRKHIACLRTIKSLIANMATGVTKVWSSFSVLLSWLIIQSRDSYTKCVRYTLTSPSIASFRRTVVGLK
jgi:ribosomal protein L6P/L9E